MTREENLDWLYRLKSEIFVFMPKEWLIPMADALDDAIKALEQEPCEDVISRKSIKQKLQEHHDFFVNAYGGFSNLPQNDKSRVDEITNCIAMVVNEPSVTPQEPVLDKIREQIKDYLRGVEIALEVLVENDPLRPKMEGAKVTLEECLELIDKAEEEADHDE